MGFTSLSSALSGLSISQRQLDVISTNISNVGTEGYSRKILPQVTQAINGRGVGVLAGTIGRNVDINLSRSLWTQVSTVSVNEVRESYLDRVGQFHGPPDRGISVASEVANLEDSFIVLADDPSDSFLQSSTVNQAVDTANKINNFSSLITELRNDAQGEILDTVRQINGLLSDIANLNQEIQRDLNIGQTTANAQDLRDNAVKELSKLIEISFFIRGDGAMVVQSNRGAELASTRVDDLTFTPSPVSASIFYPDSAAGIYIGDPNTEPSAVDITPLSPGGKLGGLIQLRDETFPKQMAQLDELAHKMALRFEAQGLRLFTNAQGAIPADDPPDTTTDPVVIVSYVGFSSEIEVNAAIINDPSLLQGGTSGATTQTGSNEVIQRVLDYTFGSVNYQEAVGTINLELIDGGYVNDTMQTFLGITSDNEVLGTRDLSSYLDATTFVNATNGGINATENTVRFTFEEADLAILPINIDIDITAVPAINGNFLDDLIDEINAQILLLPAGDQADLAAMAVNFSASTNGQLSITSTGDITLDATNPVNPIGVDNLALLGFSEVTREAEDPYFDVAVGDNDFTRITINPADTDADLLTKLNAVPGLAAGYDVTTGALELRPGNDLANPDYGGALRIVSGPFDTNGAGANVDIGAGTIDDGVNVISAIFGSFVSGVPPQNVNPIEDVVYGSDVSVTDTSTIAFREDFLGPDASISTNVLASVSLVDFSQKIVNEHTQELIFVQDQIEDDTTFRNLLQDQLLNESGVNIDQELSHLVVVQNAYAASARVVTAVDEMFQDLLNAFV